MNFELNEPTMVRFVAPIHKHIEFDIELREISGGDQYGNSIAKKLIDSGAKGFEDSIVAQLERGSYYLKLLFVGEEFFLSQPCQSISIEMAFTPISVLKKQILAKKSQSNSNFDLPELLTNYNTTHQVFKNNAIKNYYIKDPEVL